MSSSLPMSQADRASAGGPSRRTSLAALAGLYALFAAVAPVERVPIACPFRRVTGRRCPLCGLTRATRALTRGEVGRARELHRLAPLLWAGTVAGLCAMPSAKDLQ